MRLGLHYKPNPGKQEDGSRLHGHGLALALLPDPQLMLHEREIYFSDSVC